MQAKHIVVHGMVQGVGFRWFVQRIGTRLGLTGNVRNLPDLTVEIIVEGNAHKIQEFIEAVSKGPSYSHVERVEIHDVTPSGDYDSFLIEGW